MAVLLRVCLILCVFAYISATDAQSQDDSIVNSVDEALVDSLDELEREKRGAYGCSHPCGNYAYCRNGACACNPGCYRINGKCRPGGGGGGGGGGDSSHHSSGGNSNGGGYRRRYRHRNRRGYRNRRGGY